MAVGGSGSRERTIFHVDMDAFFVSVEVLLDPSLAGKPVVVGGAHGRGVVTSASYEARQYGIHAAMPGAWARRLCPHAVFLRGRHEQYRIMSGRVFALLGQYTPAVQVMSVDEAYLDMTGTERLWGHPLRVGTEILTRIRREIGLPASMGIAGNKLVAKVASDFGKPKGLTWVRPGYERAFLHPLPVERLPGVGKKATSQFAAVGIRTAGDLAGQEEGALRRLLGDWAAGMVHRARGEGSAHVSAERGQAQSMSHETTFSEDVSDVDELTGVLLRLAGKVGRRLRRAQLLGWTIHLKLRYSDFTTLTRNVTLRAPTNIDQRIFLAARDLFLRTYQVGRKVRLLGVGAAQLVVDGYQRDLFAESGLEKLRRLDRSVDRIRDKYGMDGVLRGTQLQRPSS
jgi:DNA polymerase IV